MREKIKSGAASIAKIVIAAVITTVIIVGGIQVIFGAQAQREEDLAEQLVRSNLANACLLQLPSDPDTGRDPADVKFCYTQYDLEPPKTVPEGG